MWLLRIPFLLLAMACVRGASDNSSSVVASSGDTGFGYELTMTGLDAVNFNMQQEHLRSTEHFQTIMAEMDSLRRTVASTEQMAMQQRKLLGEFESQLKKLNGIVESVDGIARIRSDLDLMSYNISRLLDDASKISRVQQTLPTTEMINNLALQLLSDRRMKPGNLPLESTNIQRTCGDIPGRTSGVRRVQPQPGFREPFQVYCDQDYEEGGWTVIQNRFNGSVHFFRGWTDYERGFGDLSGEFWLGLARIHELTYAKRHELHVVLEDDEGKRVVAKYGHMLVGGPEESYALNSLGEYSGDVGDSLSWAVGNKFTTMDADNDKHPPDNCANMYKGGWWYGACHGSNLNGLYLKGKQTAYATMMCWDTFKGLHYGLKTSRMPIRAVG